MPDKDFKELLASASPRPWMQRGQTPLAKNQRRIYDAEDNPISSNNHANQLICICLANAAEDIDKLVDEILSWPIDLQGSAHNLATKIRRGLDGGA